MATTGSHYIFDIHRENFLRCFVSHGGLVEIDVQLLFYNWRTSTRYCVEQFHTRASLMWLPRCDSGQADNKQVDILEQRTYEQYWPEWTIWTWNPRKNLKRCSTQHPVGWPVMAKSFHRKIRKGDLLEHDFAWFYSSRSSTNKQTGFEVQCDVVSNWIGTCKSEFSRMMYDIMIWEWWHLPILTLQESSRSCVWVLGFFLLGRARSCRKSMLQGLNHAEDSRPRVGQSSIARPSYERGHLSC